MNSALWLCTFLLLLPDLSYNFLNLEATKRCAAGWYFLACWGFLLWALFGWTCWTCFTGMNNRTCKCWLFVWYVCCCSAAEPPYTILQEPAESHPDFLVAEIHLPNVVSTPHIHCLLYNTWDCLALEYLVVLYETVLKSFDMLHVYHLEDSRRKKKTFTWRQTEITHCTSCAAYCRCDKL